MIKTLSYYSVLLRHPKSARISGPAANWLRKMGVKAIMVYASNLNSKEHHITETCQVKLFFDKSLEQPPFSANIPRSLAVRALERWETSHGLDKAISRLAVSLYMTYRDRTEAQELLAKVC